MFYNDYISEINRKYEEELSKIEVKYNFDYGPEYEVAICNFFSQVLPEKYGVCRGFVVNKDGETAGDDIIIYDKMNSPKLRFLPSDELSLKHYIPVEAVYAYIEAKHTLDEKTLIKALEQTEKVKRVLLTRTRREISSLIPDIDIDNLLIKPKKDSYPEMLNPPFVAIMGRNISDSIENNIHNVLEQNLTKDKSNILDLIIAGSGQIAIPMINEIIDYPFFIPNKSNLTIIETQYAIGIGMINILHALSFIRLRGMKWNYLIADCLSRPYVE